MNLRAHSCFSFYILRHYEIFFKVLLNLNGTWSWLRRYHVAGCIDSSLELRGDYKTIRLKHETMRARTQSAHKRTSEENISKFEPDSSKQLLIYPQVTETWGRRRQRGPGGPHRGHAGESDQLHGQREHIRGLARRGDPGKRGVGRTWTKGHKVDFSGGINGVLQWRKDRREKDRQEEISRNLSVVVRFVQTRLLRQKTTGT